MATEVIMPKVDMVMETGTFVEWLKQEGEQVEKGDPLFIILTDKANIEIESPASGILGGVKVKPDDVVPVTDVIAYILEAGEPLPEAAELAPVASAIAPPRMQASVSETAKTEQVQSSGGKVRATPAARRLAGELGVDLEQLAGRGPRGRIHKADVMAAVDERLESGGRPTSGAAALQIPLPDVNRKAVLPLTGPRKVIADRLTFSAFTAPHINLTLRVDMSEASRLRERVQGPVRDRTGYGISYTAIIARAVASVLPAHPFLNASLQADQIVVWDDIHLGIATSLEDYLVVPVIRQAQTRNLEELVSQLGDLVDRARAKRLTPQEMSGSTFTISNLGMFGIESFTAIINPPETAILAVGAIVDTLVPGVEGVEFLPMMSMTLCVDHRVVDGVAGARFLADLKTTLENPYLLI